MTPERELFDTVLGQSSAPTRPSRRLGHGIAWGVAATAHVALLLLASRTEPSLENWAAEIAASIHADLAAAAPVALELPAEEPPTTEVVEESEPEPPVNEPLPEEPVAVAEEPVLEPPPLERVTNQAPAEPEPEPAPTEPPPAEPAQAGALMTAEPVAEAPVDLTDNTFVTGAGSHYVGGATAESGTGLAPVDLTDVEVAGVPAGRVTGVEPSTAVEAEPARRQRSAARPVQLRGGEWRCDWPQQAISEDIYEQSVVVRVVVNVDGDVVDTVVVEDPGFGFGATAAACARARRFSPAREEDGSPIQAMSPPIRVRFTR